MSLVVQVKGEQLMLLPERAVYWPARRILLIADAHLGKAMHFRKLGVAAPAALEHGDLARIAALLTRHEPEELVILGDLFHSDHNTAWDGFKALRHAFPHIVFTLVTGNHDILDPSRYAEACLECTPERIAGPFRFTHHPDPKAGAYNMAGHVHPAVTLVGAGRQSLVLPCFQFRRNAALLPAFGRFTGGYRIAPVASDRVFVVSGGSVVRVTY
jgi:DNA ligase-associated metallophosphoesterase